MKYCVTFLLAWVMVPVTAVYAETNEKMHHNHGAHHDHSAANGIAKMLEKEFKKLDVIPHSGKSRESGYDNTAVMEASDVTDALARKCAQASRGIIMLDNAGWQSCGGKPQGAAISKLDATIAIDHQQHNGHVPETGASKPQDEHMNHMNHMGH